MLLLRWLLGVLVLLRGVVERGYRGGVMYWDPVGVLVGVVVALGF